jgi:hypothetical protein
MCMATRKNVREKNIVSEKKLYNLRWKQIKGKGKGEKKLYYLGAWLHTGYIPQKICLKYGSKLFHPWSLYLQCIYTGSYQT